MIQKYSYFDVLKVFFIEPTSIHFIREISKKIQLAPTSVRNNIHLLEKEGLIVKKEGRPFDGYVANRESEKFIFYKKVYNLLSLEDLKFYLEKNNFPKLSVIFGSYALGEDVETSDIDIFILTKGKKDIDLSRFEKNLGREINLLVVDNLDKVDKPLMKKIYNGSVLSGGFDG